MNQKGKIILHGTSWPVSMKSILYKVFWPFLCSGETCNAYIHEKSDFIWNSSMSRPAVRVENLRPSLLSTGETN